MTLTSEYLFLHKQELLTKTFSSNELIGMFTSNTFDNSFDLILSKLNSMKINNCYRNDIKSIIFSFNDIFQNEVIFQDCTLTVFFDSILCN